MNRLSYALIILVGMFRCAALHGQSREMENVKGEIPFCGSDLLHRDAGPEEIAREEEMNRILYDLLDRRRKEERSVPGAAEEELLTIPVVVHIIHDGGSENISDAQVMAGIRHMNEAFANAGIYDPLTGVNVGIAFCLARQDTLGNPTTGITRTQSGMTVLESETHDLAMKNLSRWDTRHYLNIWLVRRITSGAAGYARFPWKHGDSDDGIVGVASWFGSSADNSKMFAHEAGHYLGLYHTFEGGCANSDCLADGDRICDTPPDGSVEHVPCGALYNSCSTDEDDLSINNPFRPVTAGGMGDQEDLYGDYMDYSDPQCYSVFTQGQKERMRGSLTAIRASLLDSRGCASPCTSGLTASFTTGATVVDVGSMVSFINNSSNATAYEWRIDGAVIGTALNISHTFNREGSYVVALRAMNGDPACIEEYSMAIEVRCPVRASFTAGGRSILPGDSVTFTNTSTGEGSYRWFIDGVPVGTERDMGHRFHTAGGYRVVLVTSNGTCSDTSSGMLVRVGSCGISNEWNIWYFGEGAGVDFNSGSPVALIGGDLAAAEGTASICDEEGNLLFYTNGTEVRNRNHFTMRNGAGLIGSGISAQGALIVPAPMSDSLYYLFTTSNWTDPRMELRYSIIDMALDGGLGDVTWMKNRIISNRITERVTATRHANCTDVWIVSHEQGNRRFVAYLLTPDGLKVTPVISDAGSESKGSNRYGYLKFSQDGKRLSSSLGGSSTLPTVEVFDFDNATGEASNPIVLADGNEMPNAYSSEFSPDGRFLYVSEFNRPVLYQFDLAAGSPAEIRASRSVVAQTGSRNMSCHQLGPDGRIYTVSRGSTFLSMIEHPNRKGMACGFTLDAVDLKGNPGQIGLPNFMPNYRERSARIEGPENVSIEDSLQSFSVASPGCSAASYIWRAEGDAEIISSSDQTSVTVRMKSVGNAMVMVERWDHCGVLRDTLDVAITPASQSGLATETGISSGVAPLLICHEAGGIITIDYRLIEKGRARLSLVNVLGQRVRVLADEEGIPGAHIVTLDADELAPGIYLLALETPSRRVVEKMVVGR